MAIEGFAATMEKVIELHENYPENKESLVGKQPVQVDKKIPEAYSSLDHFKPDLNYKKQVAKSCIHCHQIRDAQRVELRQTGKPLPEKLLYPFPAPSTIGMLLDTRSASKVAKIETDSISAKAGIKRSDTLISANGQPVTSAADLTWTLHNSKDGDTISFVVDRNGSEKQIDVELPDGWRKSTDLSWRPTSWDLRRMATGGFIVESIDNRTRKKLDLKDGQMALRVKHVGQYGQHARAKRAGVRVNDILVGVDGKSDLHSESAVIEYAIQEKKPGESIRFDLIRNGKPFSATVKLQ